MQCQQLLQQLVLFTKTRLSSIESQLKKVVVVFVVVGQVTVVISIHRHLTLKFGQ